MENHFDTAYRDAFELAKSKLLELDIAQVCLHSGARLLAPPPDSRLELLYTNSLVTLALPDAAFSVAGVPELHIWDKILLLHYLANAKQVRTEGSPISFKELKSAALYYQLFENRCLKPLLRVFGSQPEQLQEKVAALGGKPLQAGDGAAQLQVLPNISLSFILWKADEEFSASASILFDAAIEQFLSAEDIVVLCQRMVLKLLGKW